MVKETLKTFVALVVAAFVALPAPAVQALSIAYNPVDEIIENMADAESVDFSLDIDLETDNDQIDQPVEVHIDLDGVTDFERKSAFDLSFVSVDDSGENRTAGGSMIMIGNTLYLSEMGGEWYFIELDTSAPTEDDIDDGVEEIQDAMNDLLDRGVIAFDAEAPDRVNGIKTTRYSYHVDMDRFVDFLVDTDQISEAQAEEMAESIDDVTIGGSLWIDTSEMLPAKFTMNIDANSSATSYTSIDVTVVFNSFNEAVKISAPKHATNLEEADFSNTEDTVDAAFEMTVASMDTDGDGLTNADEDELWNSNPLSNDTDGDGYLDYTEVINGYDPNGSGKLDSDGDGLTDYAEMTLHWTNRYDSDSDNDGYADGVEIANGYNPNGPGRW